MTEHANHIPHTHYGARKGSLRSYVIGFALSIVCTLLAYGMVAGHIGSTGLILVVIVALAIAQLLIQLIAFLHLDKETHPRWNLTAISFATIFVALVVGGSLWIMYNLNVNMMGHPATMDQGTMTDQGTY